VNGRFVDPLRVKLPRGRVLEGPLMADFDKYREPRRQHHHALEPARRAEPSGRADRLPSNGASSRFART
jgi:hypothetical protein